MKNLNGYTILAGNKYPVTLNEKSITIHFGAQEQKTIEETYKLIVYDYESIGIFGILVILSVPITSEDTVFSYTGDLFFRIENYVSQSTYNSMTLQFKELEYILPSSSLFSFNDDYFKFSRKKNILHSLPLKYKEFDLTINFEISSKESIGPLKSSKIITEPSVNICFKNTDNPFFILELFEWIRNFFAFICNRRNIDLRNATLHAVFPSKKIDENDNIVDCIKKNNQILIPNYIYIEPNEAEEEILKAPNINIFQNHITELFQLFLPQTIDEMPLVDVHFIHESSKKRNLIDLNQSIRITSTFECFVRELLPEMHSETTIEFYEDLTSILDEYIQNATGKKRKKAKSFKKSLRPNLSTMDKIIKVYNGYQDWNSLSNIFDTMTEGTLELYAETINLWRNDLAHRKREYEPNAETIKAIKFLEKVNYCIIFRKANYSDDEIRNIIEHIFK